MIRLSEIFSTHFVLYAVYLDDEQSFDYCNQSPLLTILWSVSVPNITAKEERNLSVLRLKIVLNIAYNDNAVCLIFYHSFALD